jgi:EmrB/QacA subfamily drug resistance transporter
MHGLARRGGSARTTRGADAATGDNSDDRSAAPVTSATDPAEEAEEAQPEDTPAAIRRRRWVLVVLCGGQMMITIDNTVVNVALPIIQRDLGFSQASLAWVVNAYLLAFGGFLLLAGRLGDLAGRKRVFLAGLALFTGSSLVCGLANDRSTLIAARFAQGLGAALDAAMILGILVSLFPAPRARARVMALYAFVTISGGSIGLLLGGIVTQAFSWHWIFFINVPIGVAALVFGALIIETDVGLGIRQSVDVLGALLITGAPMLAVYGFVQASGDGWGSSTTLGCLAGSVVGVVAFVALEKQLAHPLIPLHVFRYRNLARANIVRGLVGIGTYGLFFLGVLYFQQVHGYSAVRTGLAYVPFTVSSALVALLFSHRVMHRFGAKPTLIGGLAGYAVGLLLLIRVPVHGSYVRDVLPALLLAAVGGGFLTAPNISLCVGSAPPEDAGLASGLVSTSLQLGAAIGLAVLATVSATRSGHLSAHGADRATALTGGYRLGFVVVAGCMIAAMAVAFTLHGDSVGAGLQEAGPT